MGVLTPLDVNSKQQAEADTPKPFKSEAKSSDKKEVFDAVCSNRIGELLDGEDDDEDLVVWTLDDFTSIQKLGSGGSASVFSAKEKRSGFVVALKIQPAEADAILELDIHQPLSHPNIVKVIDYFFSEETPESKEEDKSNIDVSSEASLSKNLVMILEICSGCLFDFIRDSPRGFIEEKDAAKLFWDAVNAMEYTHDQDIIHCDIKSLNFLVNAQGTTLKICDFGMSVPYEERDIVGGSPVYMSPEHLMAWRHMSDDFDYRVDVYSLGVILFEMLVGYLPYEILDNHSAEDDSSLLADFGKLGIHEEAEDDAFQPPILDLRKLDDQSSEEPFYTPPPIFPDFVSPEAQDLIFGLMEPIANERITLAEVKSHPWIQKHITEGA